MQKAKENKKAIFLSIVGVIFMLGVGLWFWSAYSPKTSTVQTPVTTNIIFFYGQECPHCHDVEKFISDNNISSKVKFDSLEVWHNSANADLMMQKAKECGIPQDQVGVPFVYSDGKCYIGTPDVEKFFQQAADQPSQK